jgi:CubicO group peptidase (beta-lactamase class C family)
MVNLDGIKGHWHPDFASVAEALALNVEEDNELGAAVAVVQHGRLVVDIWTGWRDEQKSQPWEANTLVCLMSVGKAISALAIHMLADRGVIDIDAPVAHYWPEFGQAGKQDIPVRYVLSHLSSVPVADRAPPGSIFDWDTMCEAIAAQEPLWPPGSHPCYHTATQGFILGELVRRVTGESIGTFIRAQIADPLGVEYFMGLRAGELTRVADMVPSPGNVLSKAQSGGDSLLARAWAQLPRGEDFNSTDWRTHEVPSANGHGTPRAIAKIYGALALGGTMNGTTLISSRSLQQALTEQWEGRDEMSGLHFRLAQGFYLNCPPDRPMGKSPRAFGHSGAGGAQSFGDPDTGIGFCYGPNRMHSGIDIGPRAARLIDALYNLL